MVSVEELETRRDQYAARYKLTIVAELGFGNDGRIWKTNEDTAVKLFERKEAFSRELNCYQRLAEHGIEEILGFNVPTLLRFDGSLMAIEMEVVDEPFLLDFGKAYVDVRPPYHVRH